MPTSQIPPSLTKINTSRKRSHSIGPIWRPKSNNSKRITTLNLSTQNAPSSPLPSAVAENMHSLLLLSNNYLSSALLTKQLHLASGSLSLGEGTIQEPSIGDVDTVQQHDDDVSIQRSQQHRLDRQIILNKHLGVLLQHLREGRLKEALVTMREVLAKVSNPSELKQMLVASQESSVVAAQEETPISSDASAAAPFDSAHWREINDAWNQQWRKQFMEPLPTNAKHYKKLMSRFSDAVTLDELFPELLEKRIHLLAIAYFVMDTNVLLQKYIEMRLNDVAIFMELNARRHKKRVEEQIGTTAGSARQSSEDTNDAQKDAALGSLKVQSCTELCNAFASMIEMDHHCFNRVLGKWRPLDKLLKNVYIPPLIASITDTIDGSNIVDFVDTFDIFMDFRRRILSTLQIYLEVHQSIPREVFESRTENTSPQAAPRLPQSPHLKRRNSISIKLEVNPRHHYPSHDSAEYSKSPSGSASPGGANSESNSARKRRLSSAVPGTHSPTSKYRPTKSGFTFQQDSPTVDVVSVGEELLDAVNSAFIEKVANFHDSLKAYIQELGASSVEREKQQLKTRECFDTMLSPSTQDNATYISRVCFDLFAELSYIFQRLCRPIFSDIHPALFDTAKSVIQSYSWHVRDVMQKHVNASQRSAQHMNTLYVGCNILAYISNQCSVLQRFQTRQVMENSDSFNSLAVKFSILLRAFVARIVQKHLQEIQRYILIDIEASDWQSFRVFQGESRCNYGIEMWYFYVRGVAHDVRAKCRMNSMLSGEIIGHLVAHSLKNFLLLYESIFPSRIRTKQFMCDISYIIHFTRSFRSLTSSSLMSNINKYCVYLATIGATLCCPLAKISTFLRRPESEQAQRSSQFASIFELNQAQLVSIIPPNIWLPDPVSIMVPIFPTGDNEGKDSDAMQEDILQIFDYHSSLSDTSDFHASMWTATYDWDALLDACHYLHMTKTNQEMIFRLERRHEFVPDEYPELNEAERTEAAEVLEQIQTLKRGLSPVL